MAHSLSAKKRVRQTLKRRARNRARKELIKDQIKSFNAALTGGDMTKAEQELRKVGLAAGQGGVEAHDPQEHRRPPAEPAGQAAERRPQRRDQGHRGGGGQGRPDRRQSVRGHGPQRRDRLIASPAARTRIRSHLTAPGIRQLPFPPAASSIAAGNGGLPDAGCRPAFPESSEENTAMRRVHRDGTDRVALQAPRVRLSRQRDLRRPQRLLGLRPAGRPAEEQHPRLVVAEHGRWPRRSARTATPSKSSASTRRSSRTPRPGSPAATSAASATRWWTTARPSSDTAPTTRAWSCVAKGRPGRTAFAFLPGDEEARREEDQAGRRPAESRRLRQASSR